MLRPFEFSDADDVQRLAGDRAIADTTLNIPHPYKEHMFDKLKEINSRPEPFEFYTAKDLWTDAHTAKQMLSYHLNKEIDVSSRNQAFIDRSVQWISSCFKVRSGTKIVDFGCGPGLYTTRLARKKAEVIGIDFSENSIKYASKTAAGEGLRIQYVNQNYLDFETDERFDLILMIMCDFCALSPAQRKEMLDKFHTILAPGGAVLLDVYSLAAFAWREEEYIYEDDLLDGFWSSSHYYGFRNTFKYDREKVILDKFTIVEPKRIRTIYNWLQYFSPEALEKEFVRSGLMFKALYSDVAGSPYDANGEEFAVVGRKL